MPSTPKTAPHIRPTTRPTTTPTAKPTAWPSPTSRPLDQTMVDEWYRWRRSRRGIRCWQAWADQFPCLGAVGADPARSLVTVGGPRMPHLWPVVDQVHAALVWLTQHSPDTPAEAAHTLSTMLRPGLVRLARDRQRAPSSSYDRTVDEEVVATFFEVILTHDLNRRPSRIAANVLLDTRQRMARSASSGATHRLAIEPSCSDATPTQVAHPSTSDGGSTVWLRAALASELAELPGVEHTRRQTAEIVYRAWFLEQSHGGIAADVGLSPGAVTTRLCRVRQGLRRSLFN